MIVRQFYKTRNDGVSLYRSYSNKDKYIKKVGTEELYSEAIDIDGAPYVYEETDIDIEKLEEPRLIP